MKPFSQGQMPCWRSEELVEWKAEGGGRGILPGVNSHRRHCIHSVPHRHAQKSQHHRISGLKRTFPIGVLNQLSKTHKFSSELPWSKALSFSNSLPKVHSLKSAFILKSISLRSGWCWQIEQQTFTVKYIFLKAWIPIHNSKEKPWVLPAPLVLLSAPLVPASLTGQRAQHTGLGTNDGDDVISDCHPFFTVS